MTNVTVTNINMIEIDKYSPGINSKHEIRVSRGNYATAKIHT